MIKQILLRLWSYVKKHAGLLFLAILSTLISVIGTLAAPVIIGQVVNGFVKPGAVDFTAILKMLSILIGVYLCVAFFLWLLNRTTSRLAYKTVNILRDNLFSKLSILPLASIDKHPHGDMISRFINDADVIADGLILGLITLFSGIVTVILAIMLMLTIDPIMTLVVSASGPLAFFITRLNVKKSQPHFKEQAALVGELNAFAEEIIPGQRIVRAFGHEKQSLEHFETINQRLRNAGIKAQFISSFANPTSRIVNNVIYTFVGVTAGLEAIAGNLSVGDITGFLIFAVIFAKPFNDFTGILTQVQAAVASAQRVFAILDLPPETPERKNPITPDPNKRLRGRITFHDVSFSYSPEKNFIQHFDLDVPPGSMTALVGHTGAGKTTLVNLLMRFYDISSGSIEIDGVDIRDMTRNDLCGNFGMVLQDTWLFEGSIRDNISYARPNAPIEKIIHAAKSAGADDFIRQLENGYDTIIRDAGANLSQGQKQLLAIARIMLTEPSILILDEATSNIDTRTELRIQRAFSELSAGKTSFIIAHRLSTIRNADNIIVMDHGRIIETGQHETLLRKGGSYANLYYSQFAVNRSFEIVTESFR